MKRLREDNPTHTTQDIVLHWSARMLIFSNPWDLMNNSLEAPLPPCKTPDSEWAGGRRALELRDEAFRARMPRAGSLTDIVSFSFVPRVLAPSTLLSSHAHTVTVLRLPISQHLMKIFRHQKNGKNYAMDTRILTTWKLQSIISHSSICLFISLSMCQSLLFYVF